MYIIVLALFVHHCWCLNIARHTSKMDGRPKLNYDGADEPINKLRREFMAPTFPPTMMKDLAAMGVHPDQSSQRELEEGSSQADTLRLEGALSCSDLEMATLKMH